MRGPLYRFFSEDHRRLDGLLRRAVGCPYEIDRAAYAEFRAASEVPVAPHVDGPRVIEATRRALARAGYNLGE